MASDARQRRAVIVLVVTWVAIAAVVANWLVSRRTEANAKADMQAREAEFMAKMDKIAAEEAAKAKTESSEPTPAESPAPEQPDAPQPPANP